MKGLILIYGVAGLGTLAALWRPAIGLYVYVAFAVLRPEGIWGWAGDLSGISLVVGIATLVGWFLKAFGTRQFGRGRIIVFALLAFFVDGCVERAIRRIDVATQQLSDVQARLDQLSRDRAATP